MLLLTYIWNAVVICRRFAMHWVVRACVRALFRAGRRIEISIAMMPITTRSSTSVKARAVGGRFDIT